MGESEIPRRIEYPILINGEPFVPNGYKVERQADGYYTFVTA